MKSETRGDCHILLQMLYWRNYLAHMRWAALGKCWTRISLQEEGEKLCLDSVAALVLQEVMSSST